ncbi:rubrerythrin family protein [Clostridium tertium]|jgi:rubrerythrin|uniref:Rubrerythrin family protein n=1 Tax=Clostridium tertium TaxID=1559 RepID=A0A9X4B178_9CLOT|nr:MULTISPECIES: rubrerythrin family protein [Clostridium]EEH99574.1 rubrerythrin [Clostridium sp. 7_2_43FAA]MBP1869395.1 rubrerythrin [Clostridium tertium]MBS5308054.1 rubrerythrin family protein [Clostridium sp.]MBS6502638.1 rubrerythrin family protein [Clostridium sp.]MBU6136877.1 rubrerythrin family protein [Clostridium tertium]
MKSLNGTKTAENLMKSFAGESQARTRYTYYASVARKQGYVQIANIFMETAEQEKEHAKRFYKFLKDDFAGEAIEINAAYPVDLYDDTAKNLRAAAKGEHEEWSHDYPEFARVAREEGFPAIAVAYERITEVENRHERRYNKLLKNIEEGKVFKKDEPVLWKCNNCGYIFEGEEAPQVCPACLHPQGYFEVFVENY